MILIFLIAASAVLVVEFGMSAAAGLIVFRPGVERFTDLTGFTPSRLVYRVLGMLALFGVAGIIGGAWWPAAAVVAAAYFALLSGFTLTRQVQRGQRGRALFAYSLFLASALIVIAIRVPQVR